MGGPECTGCGHPHFEASTCIGSCCDQYCSEELQQAGHYCGADGCDCGVCPGPDCTGCVHPHLNATARMHCSGSCCDEYCSKELQHAGHYCGLDGCDCGVCPGPECTGCGHPHFEAST